MAFEACEYIDMDGRAVRARWPRAEHRAALADAKLDRQLAAASDALAVHTKGATACVMWLSATDHQSVASNYTTYELLDDHLFSSSRGERTPCTHASSRSTRPALFSPPHTDCGARRVCRSCGCCSSPLPPPPSRHRIPRVASLASSPSVAVGTRRGMWCVRARRACGARWRMTTVSGLCRRGQSVRRTVHITT